MSLPTRVPRAATAEGQAGIDAILAAPAAALLACDFDGTLSPIVPDPAKARAQPGAAAALGRLATRAGTVAIITGRAAADAVELGGFAEVPGLIVLGHYGAQRWENGTVTARAVPDGVSEVRRQLPRVVAQAVAAASGRGLRAGGRAEDPGLQDGGLQGSGLRIEDKGDALAVHTRQAPDPEGALAALTGPLKDLAERTGLTVEPGRFVLELRPPGTDKGAALRALAAARAARSVMFCGDDLGDLAAFAAVRELRAAGVPGCTVASRSPETPRVAEAADLAVDGPPGVVALLTTLAGLLGALQHCKARGETSVARPRVPVGPDRSTVIR